MNNNKILRIIHEEIGHQEGLIFEGMTYTRGNGYRNNQLLEVYDSNGKLLLTEGWIDDVQSVLDYAGFIPGIGDLFDALNATLYLFRKKWILGGLSFVAAVPFVGSIIATPFKILHKLIGKTLTKIFTKMTSNGKAAANIFLDLLSKGSSKVKGYVKEIYTAIAKNAKSINNFLDTLIPKVNGMIKSASWGYFSLPTGFVKSGNAVIKQIKDFFSGLAKGKAYKSTKNIAKDKVKTQIKNLTTDEKEAYTKAYSTKKVDKEDYPTLEDFMVAQIELKNTTSKLKKMGEDLDKKSKQMVATFLKKPGNEIKLWSKGDVVKLVQRAVGVKEDGQFGEGTEKAVKIVQKKQGLIPDGVVGPDTWAKIT
tara:strand:- start:24 stop:1118 length:1095 start_codon:yes stop_codon:yes gene_type:complete